MQEDRQRKDAHSASDHYALSMIVEAHKLKFDTGSTYKIKSIHDFRSCILILYKTKYLAL
jgi:hypothetical protein